MTRSVLSLAVTLLLASPAAAFIRVSNQPLDRSLYPRYKDRAVIAGTITEVRVERPEDAAPRGRPVIDPVPDPSFIKFHVDTVILGDKALKDAAIEFRTDSFDWPAELVPQVKDGYCILVIRLPGRPEKLPSIYSVVPARRHEYPSASGNEEAQRILSRELVEQIKQENSPQRQWHLLLQVGPILTAADAPAVVPLLDAKNIWLKRAAVGGLARATRDPKYVQMVITDVREFLKTTKLGDEAEGLDPGARRSAYYLLLNHYFFLRTGWSEEGNAESAAYAEAFRLFARSLDKNESAQWLYGIKPLCIAGTKDDLKLLYDYYCSDRLGPRRRILGNPSYRQALLMGISRILNLGLLNWQEKDFIEKEDEQHRQVREALLKLGVIQDADDD